LFDADSIENAAAIRGAGLATTDDGLDLCHQFVVWQRRPAHPFVVAGGLSLLGLRLSERRQSDG